MPTEGRRSANTTLTVRTKAITTARLFPLLSPSERVRPRRSLPLPPPLSKHKLYKNIPLKGQLDGQAIDDKAHFDPVKPINQNSRLFLFPGEEGSAEALGTRGAERQAVPRRACAGGRRRGRPRDLRASHRPARTVHRRESPCCFFVRGKRFWASRVVLSS